MIHPISVFSVKFNVEFTSYAMNFSIEGSKENDLIIKAATRNIKTRTNLLFSLTLQAVRINNRGSGAPLLGLAKSKYIYYMEESVLLGTKPLVDSIRHFIRDPSGVFSVCHLSECRIVQ